MNIWIKIENMDKIEKLHKIENVDKIEIIDKMDQLWTKLINSD